MARPPPFGLKRRLSRGPSPLGLFPLTPLAVARTALGAAFLAGAAALAPGLAAAGALEAVAAGFGGATGFCAAAALARAASFSALRLAASAASFFFACARERGKGGQRGGTEGGPRGDQGTAGLGQTRREAFPRWTVKGER